MGTGAGAVVDDADFAAITAASSGRQVGRLVQSGTQALANNTQVALTWSTEDFDTGSFHSTVTNPTRVTPNVPGYYRFTFTAFMGGTMTANSTIIDANIRTNGVNNIPPGPRDSAGINGGVSLFATVLIPMNGTTDYVELVARQQAGVGTTTNQSQQFSSVLEWEYVRAL